MPPEPFTADDAKALALRLEMGLSVLDEDGREVAVLVDQQKRAARAAARPGAVPGDGCGSGAAARQRAREEAEARAAELTRQWDADRERASAAVLDHLRGRDQLRRALPCYPLDPRHGAQGGSDAAAASACQVVRAYREFPAGSGAPCPWATDPTNCARNRVDEAYARVAARLRDADVPPELARRILGARPGHRTPAGHRAAPVALELRPALVLVQAWLTAAGVAGDAAQPASLLVLAGAQRSGKSLAAAYACADRDGARWTSIAALASIPMREYRHSAFVEPPLLIGDDLGCESLTPIDAARLGAVLAERHTAGRPTILTTNLDREQFRARYDERIDRRIAESGRWARLPEWTP